MAHTIRRSATPFLVAALAACALLAAPAAAPAKAVPSLASTAQYKAFIAYVKKLDGLAGTPVSPQQKASYEAELTTKKEAAAHKANALFKRASGEAQAESNAKSKEQTEAVRRAEEEELEALHAEIDGKLERATSSYHGKLERLTNGHRKFESKTQEKISKLRSQKAKSADVAKKNAIQERITGLIGQLTASRQEEKEKRGQLQSGFRTQKSEINASEDKGETEIGEAAEEKVAKIAKHWKNAYNEKKAALNSKRENQLGYLEAKLEKGRADIAAMPPG